MRQNRAVLRPWQVGAVVVIPALLLALLPAGGELFALRQDTIESGQLWRLWTGHWVHWSWSHLVWDAVALAMVTTRLEHFRPQQMVPYLLFSAPIVSLSLLVLCPEMAVYGGLSGLATGAAVLLAAHLMKKPGKAWLLGAFFGILIVTKLWGEMTQPLLGFVSFESSEVRTEPLAHVLGATTAFITLLLPSPPTARRQPTSPLQPTSRTICS